MVGRNLGMAGAPFIIAGVLSGAIICAFGWFMPRARKVARALWKAFWVSRIFLHTSKRSLQPYHQDSGNV